MTRWYRRYTGTVSDPKFAEAALMAACSRSVVIATFDAILESAADLNEGGSFKATPRNVAATLQEQVATVEAVFAALAELKIIENSAVSMWKKRQFESDSSTERSRKHRECKKKINENKDAKPETPPQRDATLQGRRATPPDTESDTDTDTDVVVDVARTSGREAADRNELASAMKRITDTAKPILRDGGMSPGLMGTSAEISKWLKAGCDIDDDVLPVIQAAVAKGSVINSWKFFSAAIVAAKANREAPLPPAQPGVHPHEAHRSRPPRALSIRERALAAIERGNAIADAHFTGPEGNG